MSAVNIIWGHFAIECRMKWDKFGQFLKFQFNQSILFVKYFVDPANNQSIIFTPFKSAIFVVWIFIFE